MKKLALQGKDGWGKFALVDDEDFEILNQYNWLLYYHRYTEYAFRYVRLPSGKQKRIYLHRDVLGYIPNGYIVDHANKNGLDNRRENLRICTNSENRRNSKVQKNNTSGYKGISLDKRTGTYRVRLNVDGTRRSFGYYSSPELAARKYDELAKEHYGEFASLNFPE